MAKADPSNRLLFAGLAVSMLAHISIWGVASGFVRIGNQSDRQADKTAPRPEDPPEPKPRIHLGIDESKAEGLSWLGYAEATEHSAPLSSVDQSAMSPQPGDVTEAQAPAAPPPNLQPPAPPRVRSAQVEEAAQTIVETGRRLSDAIRRATRPPEDQSAKPEPQTPQNPSTSPPSQAAKPRGNPGLPADKESLASSVKKAPSVKPGQVLAANGLDIQTKAPKWSYTTMRTRRPANPTVQITFGRDGKVVRAGFATDGVTIYSTGYEDVDEPLLSAVYSWTAKGKKLVELTNQDPDGEVTILITILLS
jgi:hypothetical protein